MRLSLRGLVALVLAAGVAICTITLAVGAAVQTGPISQEDATLLSTVLGAAVGAVATYLGGRGAATSVPIRSPSEPPDAGAET